MLAIFQIHHKIPLAELIVQFAIIELHHDQPLFETFGSYLHIARANSAAHAKLREATFWGHFPGHTGPQPGTLDDAAPPQAPGTNITLPALPIHPPTTQPFSHPPQMQFSFYYCVVEV